MKSKNFALRFLVTVIVGFLVWWFLRPMPKAPEKTVSAPVGSNVGAPKPASPNTIAPPIATPVVKSVIASFTITSLSDAKADPQTNLKTALLDIARLIRDSNDMQAYIETYTPPDKLTPELIQQLQAGRQHNADLAAQNPLGQRIFQGAAEAMARDYESLANQTPTYNEAGDEATYTWTKIFQNLEPQQRTTIFIKINGKWYLKPNDESN